MLDLIVYLFYRAGTAIASALPLRLLFILGEFLGLCAWFILPGYRRLSQRNVAIAFGSEKSPAELRRLVRRHFQKLGANFLCSVKLSTMPAEKILRRVTVENIEAIGIIETKEVAPAIYAGDAAVKSANIKLIEARNQPGGKGLVVLAGEVGAVRTAVAAGVASIKKEGMLIAEVVIPYAHEAVRKNVMS